MMYISEPHQRYCYVLGRNMQEEPRRLDSLPGLFCLVADIVHILIYHCTLFPLSPFHLAGSVV